MHACVVETTLHSIGQANQKAVLSTASVHADRAIAREVWGHALPRKKLLKLRLNLRAFSRIYIARGIILH